MFVTYTKIKKMCKKPTSSIFAWTFEDAHGKYEALHPTIAAGYCEGIREFVAEDLQSSVTYTYTHANTNGASISTTE